MAGRIVHSQPLPHNPGVNKSPHDTCTLALRWALSIDSVTTPERLRKALPPGVQASKAEWVEGDQAVGNAVDISGQLRGSVVFGAARSKNVERETASMVLLYLAPKDMSDYNAGEQFASCVRSINQSLKKRGRVTRMADDYPPVSGKAANWSVSNGRKLTLYEHWYGNGVTLMMDIKPRTSNRKQ
jgi:hypothetical protein